LRVVFLYDSTRLVVEDGAEREVLRAVLAASHAFLSEASEQAVRGGERRESKSASKERG